MEELIELLLQEIQTERKFYAQNGNLFDVEERVMKALNIVLIKVQARAQLGGEEL